MSKVSNWLISMAGNVIWNIPEWNIPPYPSPKPQGKIMPVVDIGAQNFFPISKYLCTECCGNNPLYNAHLKTNTEFSTKKLNLKHPLGGGTL